MSASTLNVMNMFSLIQKKNVVNIEGTTTLFLKVPVPKTESNQLIG